MKPIKLCFFTETRRLPEAPKTFAELQGLLKEYYNIPNPIVQYKDEDGDLITVSTQPEYEDALELCGDSVVKLNVLTMNSLRYRKASGMQDFDSIYTVPMTESRISGAMPSLRSSFVPEVFSQERSEVVSDFQSLLKYSKIAESSDSEEFELENPIKEADEQLEASKEQPTLDKHLETLPVECREAEAGLSYAESFAQTDSESVAQEVQTDDYDVYTAITDCFSTQLCRYLLGPAYPSYPHHGTRCADCGTAPVLGARFLCEDCIDFNLCESCMMRSKHPHLFLKVKPPQLVEKLKAA